MSKVRLFVDHPLRSEQSVPLTREQAQYLFAVMRLPVGSVLSVFNGKDGEWDAAVVEGNKRNGVLRCTAQISPQVSPPDLWLIFAPIKKARTDFIVEKAVELGVRRLCPVMTEFTNSERVRVDRLQAHAREAAEQCGATFVPEVSEPVKLRTLLDRWKPGRSLVFCDETARTSPAVLPKGCAAPAAIVVGPEGGFSERERSWLRETETSHTISLGPRILRAETAAIVALALWQAQFGDWS